MTTELGSGQRETKDAACRTVPVLEAMFRFIVFLVPTLAKFPRRQKFLLGDTNFGLEKLCYLLRLCVELRYLDLRRYEYAARSLDEIGRLVGGWIKANRAAQA